MKYGSVCSGIEAASSAWHSLGWQAEFFSEIEKFPCAVLAHHYTSVPNYGDMTKFKEWPDAKIDVLVGGTPCQSFSVAGLRAGLADPRGNLMLTYLAIADRYRPEWLVWENVPGVLSSNGGRDFGTFLGGLAKLGYGFAYRVLDAQYFGVPQRRRRVFVVANLRDWRRAAAVLFERESLRGDSPPSREAGEGIAPTISARPTGGGGLGTDFDCDGGLIAHSLRAEGFDASEDGTGRGTPLIHCPPIVPQAMSSKLAKGSSGPAGDEVANLIAFDTTQITSTANYSNPRPGDPCHPLAAGAHPPAIAIRTAQTSANGHGIAEEVAHTLDGAQGQAIVSGADLYNGALTGEVAATLGTPGSSVNASGPTILATQVRRLTVEECEALQGFPRGYTAISYRGKPAADGPRYKALGNSMAVPVMRWIGERIELISHANPQ